MKKDKRKLMTALCGWGTAALLLLPLAGCADKVSSPVIGGSEGTQTSASGTAEGSAAPESKSESSVASESEPENSAAPESEAEISEASGSGSESGAGGGTDKKATGTVTVTAADKKDTGTGTAKKPAEAPKKTPGTGTAQPSPAPSVQASVPSAMDILCAPSGIALMEDGTLLVTDTYYKCLWLVRDRASEAYAGGETPTGLYGEPLGGYSDGGLLSSCFQQPWAVARFLDGWAVSDTGNGVVRIVRGRGVQTLNGRTQEASLEVGDLGVSFDRPTGLASDGAGNLYVSDTGKGAVRKVSPSGQVSTLAEGLLDPMGLCWKGGALYIAEAGANRIMKVEAGTISVVAGSSGEGHADGPAPEALFASPQGVAVGDDGTVYVADTLNSAVRRIRGGQVDTLSARETGQPGFGMVAPTGLLVQGGKLYVCDGFAKKVYVLGLE